MDVAQSNRWIQNGMEASRNGRHDQAQEMLERAIETRPRDPVLREHLANTFIQQGKIEPAIEQLSRSIELSGKDPGMYVKLGRLYLENGQWIPASQFAKLALESDRDCADAWALRAETKLVKGQLTDALADYQRALSNRSDFPEVQLKVAQIQRLLGRPLRAFSAVEQLLNESATGEQQEPALLLAGQLLIDINQPAQAIEKLQIAANRQNASAECFVQLCNAQLASGQPSQARLTLVKAKGLHPESSAIANRLVELQDNNQRIASIELPASKFTR